MSLPIKLIFISLFISTALFAQEEDTTTALSPRERIKQIISPENIEMTPELWRDLLDNKHPFAVYKDMFFVSGIPLNEKITKNSADAMFQISVRQRLTKSVLPFNSFAYLTYTQKSFWDIYAKSSPFYDNNYNPGIGLGRYIIRDNKLIGGTFVQLKHESNGLDNEKSRSWNYLNLFGKYFFHKRLAMSFETWVPFMVDRENNKDLLKYRGYFIIAVNHITRNQKWWFSSFLNPREGWGNVDMQASVSFKLSPNSNQYFFAQIYHGYAEGLMDYNQYHFNLRVGVCIKPSFFSVY